MADIDLAAIFNEANTIASLAQTTISGDLSTRGSAIPQGKTTSDLTWPGKNRGPIGHSFSYGNVASDHGWAQPTQFSLLCTWDYGGTYQGLGLYIANVHLFLSIDNLTTGAALDVSGTFDDPTPTGDHGSPVAQLAAHVTFNLSQFKGLNEVDRKTVNFTLRGDGAGTATII